MNKVTKIIGTAVVVEGNDIDTDRITPARFLKETTFENMGKYAFYDERFDEKGNKKQHPFNECKNASILIVNKNFGCGSSREHAPQSLKKFGINAIIGESFADIFASNCTIIGLVIFTASKNEIDRLIKFAENKPEKSIELNVYYKKAITEDFEFDIDIDESSRKSFLEGTWDMVYIMLDSRQKIVDLMTKLPYIKNFES